MKALSLCRILLPWGAAAPAQARCISLPTRECLDSRLLATHGTLRAYYRLHEHPPSRKFKSTSSSSPSPPRIPQTPEPVTLHGVRWRDEYSWMEDREDPNVIAHLQAETAHFWEFMRSCGAARLSGQLYKAMRAHLQPIIRGNIYPERSGDFLYYSVEGTGNFPVLCRRHAPRPLLPAPATSSGRQHVSMAAAVAGKGLSGADASNEAAGREDLINTGREHLNPGVRKVSNQPGRERVNVDRTAGDELVVLDPNGLSEMSEDGYVHVGRCEVSPDHQLVAFTLDTTPRELFSAYVRQVSTGDIMGGDDVIADVVGICWVAEDEKYLGPRRLLYTSLDTQAHRPSRVMLRTLGTPRSQDVELLHEDDGAFFVDVSRSKDWALNMLNSNSKTSSEVWLLAPAREGNTQGEPKGDAGEGHTGQLRRELRGHTQGEGMGQPRDEENGNRLVPERRDSQGGWEPRGKLQREPIATQGPKPMPANDCRLMPVHWHGPDGNGVGATAVPPAMGLPGLTLTLVQPRREGLRYFVEHHAGWLYILTNWVPPPRGDINGSSNGDSKEGTRAPLTHSNDAPDVAQPCHSARESGKNVGEKSGWEDMGGEGFVFGSGSREGPSFRLHVGDVGTSFRVVRAPLATPGASHWEEVVPARPGVVLEDLDMFQGHAVLRERAGGMPRLTVMPMPPPALGEALLPYLKTARMPFSGGDDGDDGNKETSTPLSLQPGANVWSDTKLYRFEVSSPVAPPRAFDLHLDTGECTPCATLDEITAGASHAVSDKSPRNNATAHPEQSQASIAPTESAAFVDDASKGDLKGNAFHGTTMGNPASNGTARDQHQADHTSSRKSLPKGTPSSIPGSSPDTATSSAPRQQHLYMCRVVQCPALDGASIPMTLVHARDMNLDGNNPVVLSAYGAYGEIMDVGYDVSRLPLLEQGWVFAFPHVRGGGELGPTWHAAAIRHQKPRSCTDYIACAEYLVRAGISRRGLLTGHAHSAGGLLLAAVINMRPDLLTAAVARV
eukprot:jgi/Mesvir1/14688/Mv05349-RA.3